MKSAGILTFRESNPAGGTPGGKGPLLCSLIRMAGLALLLWLPCGEGLAADGAVRSDAEEPALASTAQASPTNAPGVKLLAGWVTIKSENFDGAWPNTWQVEGTHGDPVITWGPTTYSSVVPRSSPKTAGSQCSVINPAEEWPYSPESGYLECWLTYGPFSLADATDARLTFYTKYWLGGGDSLWWVASVDDIDYYGSSVTGGSASSWTKKTLDLKAVDTLGNLCGQSAVYVAILCQWDAVQNYVDGPFIDDLLLEKYVADVNVAPVITEGASVSVTMSEDGLPTAFSLTLHATDANAGSTLTWSVPTQAGHGTATAAGTGTSKAVGYVPSGNWHGADSFVVRVSDGALTDEITVNVTVQPVNDPPSDVVLSKSTVAENLPSNVVVGTFSTTDPDTGDTFTCTRVSGEGSADNASFTISGNALRTAASFNYEAKTSYAVRVRTTDPGALWYEKAFTITVTDVEEPSPVMQCPEFLSDRTVVIRWSSLTNHRYSVHHSTNLLAGFSVLRSNLEATPPCNSYTDAVHGVQQKFWKSSTEP